MKNFPHILQYKDILCEKPGGEDILGIKLSNMFVTCQKWMIYDKAYGKVLYIFIFISNYF